MSLEPPERMPSLLLILASETHVRLLIYTTVRKSVSFKPLSVVICLYKTNIPSQLSWGDSTFVVLKLMQNFKRKIQNYRRDYLE